MRDNKPELTSQYLEYIIKQNSNNKIIGIETESLNIGVDFGTKDNMIVTYWDTEGNLHREIIDNKIVGKQADYVIIDEYVENSTNQNEIDEWFEGKDHSPHWLNANYEEIETRLLSMKLDEFKIPDYKNLCNDRFINNYVLDFKRATNTIKPISKSKPYRRVIKLADKAKALTKRANNKKNRAKARRHK